MERHQKRSAMSETLEATPRARRPAVLVVALIVVVVGGGLVVWLTIGSASGLSSHVGPERVLIYDVATLAPANTTVTGKTIDGISCRREAKETVKYHVHSHVEIYVNGMMMRLPAGIGITNPQITEKYATGLFYDVGGYDCLYWLHTHVDDGIIHVESPAKQAFTLGEFFDIWNQPLGPHQVGPAKGSVVVFENGKRLTGDPRSTPLLAQGELQIDVGTPVVPFRPFIFKVSGGCGQGTLSCSIPAK
jgi:hypothetical protein